MRIVLLLCFLLTGPVQAREPMTLDDFYTHLSYGNVKQVREYMQAHRVDVNALAGPGECEGLPLLQCAGSAGVMEILLQNGARIDQVTNGQTALDHAASEKDGGEAARFLLKKGAKPSGRTLHAAIWYENTELAYELIDMGVDVNYRDADQGYTPLLIACENGRPLSLIKKLIERGAKLDVVTNEGFAALHFFPSKRSTDHQGGAGDTTIGEEERLEKTTYLLSKGAKLDVKTKEGFTPLHIAVQSGDEIAMLLIEKGANIQAVSNTGATMLQLAAGAGSARLVKYFLDHGANVQAKNGEGYTAIFYGAQSGSGEVVKLLLDKGAVCTDYGKDRKTPLFLIAMFPTAEAHYETLEENPQDFYTALTLVLQKSGPALIHSPDIYGETPWFLLKGWMYPLPEKIRLFLKNGANKNARNPSGQTLLDVLQNELRDEESSLADGARENIEESIRVLKNGP